MELTYPISTNYVPDWTVVRAASEILSNALDADPKPRILRDKNRVVIVDRGTGWQPRSLVLGESTKTAQEIGQFGEGAKLALLVLAREGRRPRIHTNNTLIEAHIGTRTIGFGGVEESVELMILTITGTVGRSGTAVSFDFDDIEEEELRNRFLYCRVRGYKRPEDRSRIVGGAGGRIFVGGVLLSSGRDLLLSYDLPLAHAKHLIGRDRDIVDPWELGREIGEAIGSSSDVAALTTITGAALLGELPVLEQRFVGKQLDTPQTRRAWRQVRRALFGKENLYWDDEDTPAEHRLKAEDAGWWRVPARCGAEVHREIMKRLGIRHISEITPPRKPRRVPRSALNETEKRNLGYVKRRIRSQLGAAAATNIEIFRDHPDPDCLGEYDATGDVIRVRRDQLAEREALARVVIHETAHRQALLAGLEWWDRTRGFEQVLTEIAATMLLGGRNRPQEGP